MSFYFDRSKKQLKDTHYLDEDQKANAKFFVRSKSNKLK